MRDWANSLHFCCQFMPIVVVMFAMGAAMGQFGCYWYDGALRLSFSKLSNETGVEIPSEIDVLFNILRATSLFHIFYGFCLLLVFHLSLIFMIQSSMREFNGELFCWTIIIPNFDIKSAPSRYFQLIVLATYKSTPENTMCSQFTLIEKRQTDISKPWRNKDG